MQYLIYVVFGVICFDQVFAMDNGLARTPPMGWLAWERFRCNTDCANYPDTCISEKLFKDMADRLYEDGWVKYGYNRVNIDDCWASKQRAKNGSLVADPKRFPSGIKSLADYVHKKGIKLGIYGDYGTKTCAGYPGSQGYEAIDAQTFADWGVDMLKFDGCNSNASMQEIGYPLMSKELNKTGRPIVYSCSWPAYRGGKPPAVNYTQLGEICNLWRNYGDIQDSFESVKSIIKWWGDNQDFLIPAAGPGKWNDPDMLLSGDFSLSLDQSKLQFGMWAILAAPMFMSNDLRKLSVEAKEVLSNVEIIRVSQDPMGMQGRRIKNGNIQLWVRPLMNEEQAIAVISFSIGGGPSEYTFMMSSLNITKPYDKYQIRDLYKPLVPSKNVKLDDPITVNVDPSGIVMLKAVPITVREEVKVVEEYLEFDLL